MLFPLSYILIVKWLENCEMVCSLWLTPGVAKSSKNQPAKDKTCRSVPKDLLDPNDFECSLCMR